jgi:hypothetical protein
MAQRNAKDEIVTFKADASLLDALRGVPNRSEFIRSAVLAALDSTCPLCKGTGNLTPHQRSHWQVLTDDHSLEECNNCHEYHLVCSHQPEAPVHGSGSE